MNLKGVLSPVYNALFQTNGFQKIDRFLDIFAPDDPDMASIRDTHTNRVMSELSPKVLKSDPAWQKAVPFENLSFEMQQALLDPDFQAVLNESEPDYAFHVEQPTLGLIARVPIIQQIALVEQIGHAKKKEFLSCIDELNDEQIFHTVCQKMNHVCPELLDYMSQKHYRFKLHTDPKDIVKTTASTWRKADTYAHGPLDVPDGVRIRLIPEIDQDFTHTQYTSMRNQIMAYMITGQLGFNPTRLKDNVSDTIKNGGKPFVYPACNINGMQDYRFELKNNESVITRFSSEVQFVPLNSAVAHYETATLAARGDERHGRAFGNSTDKRALRFGLIEEMWHDMPHLHTAAKKRTDDPSRDIINTYIGTSQSHPVLTTRASTDAKHCPSDKIVNLGLSSDLIDLAMDPMTKRVLDEMIQPYSPELRLKLMHQNAQDTTNGGWQVGARHDQVNHPVFP